MSDKPRSSHPDTTRLGSVFRCGFVGMAVLAGLAAWLVGQSYLALVVSLPLAAGLTVFSRLWSAIRRRLVYDFIRHPLRRDYRKYAWQFLLRSATCAMGAGCLVMAVPRDMFSVEELLWVMLTFAWVPAGLLLAMQLFPARHVSRSVNALYALAAAFLGVQLVQVYLLSRFSEPIVIQPPFRGEWVVLQGGRSTLINHHYSLQSQCYALDLLGLEEGTRLRGDPESLESYVCFGKPLFAPASGAVVRVVNDRPDQEIGSADPEFPVGNHVVIDIGNGRFVLLAHLKQDSVVVREGETVAAGDRVAQCGNSGNTSEPHLHVQIQNRGDFFSADLETYPIRFEGAIQIRGGASHAEQQGELRRNDRVTSRPTDRAADGAASLLERPKGNQGEANGQ